MSRPRIGTRRRRVAWRRHRARLTAWRDALSWLTPAGKARKRTIRDVFVPVQGDA